MIQEFHPYIDREKVFRQIHCYPDSPVYDEMVETFEDIKDEMLRICTPAGIAALGIIPGQFFQKEKTGNHNKDQEAVFILVTIGQEISDRSTKAFSEGDYVQGMMIDAIADSILFSLEDDIQRELRTACAVWKRGVAKRLEAPQDISMDIQEEVLRCTEAKERLGVELSSGYMFRPLKTSSNIFLTTEDEGIFKTQHNCRTCPNVKCQLRHVEPLKIKVITSDEKQMEVELLEETLLEALQRKMEGLQSPCGGRGACGKCRIQVLEGELPVTGEDKKIFTENELRMGWRLACQAFPKEEVTIRLGWESESGMETQVIFRNGDKAGRVHSETDERIQSQAGKERNRKYGFAIDIGTTTLAIQLIDMSNGNCIGTCTGLNSQRMYGADVITRIQASNEGKGEELTRHIRDDLWKYMKRLCEEYDISMEDLDRIAIAGNTTMIHLLMGFPCEGLGKTPFTPYMIKKIEQDGKTIFPGVDPTTKLQIYPGISAFVGADIVAGMCALQMEEEDGIHLLVDLGTNGEMALGNREKFLVTSVAAGPAFEGGNITWGTGSIPGAVCGVQLEDGKLSVKTIQDKPPVGICGTGVVEMVAELVKNDEIDETGCLQDPWFAQGYPIAYNHQGEQICLTQKDIREIQLAKAAVRGGIETLLHEYGITADQVQRIYVAGGFGYKLDYDKAIQIGMFPAEFTGKIQAVGNSSLEGAVELLCQTEKMNKAEKIVDLAQEINLSSNPVFQQAYMDAMFFEEE